MALLRRSRLRRGPVLLALAVAGVLGSLLILVTQLRPGLSVYAPVAVEDARVGTSYAVDDQVCLTAAQVGARVRDVRVLPAGPLELEVGLPPREGPPVIAFPVAGDALRPAEGARVPARDLRCLRLLLTPTEQGEFRAPQLEVSVGYGPFGLLRRSFDVRPPVTVRTGGEGADPRLEDGTG